MQFSKPSKKTRTIASEPVAANESNNAKEVTSKPRTARSSKTKTEVPDVKHRKPVAANASAETKPLVRAAAAAASASSLTTAVEAPIVDPVGVMTSVHSPVRTTTHAEIAELAHSYWIARGRRHGSPEEDWLRAEQELLGVS